MVLWWRWQCTQFLLKCPKIAQAIIRNKVIENQVRFRVHLAILIVTHKKINKGTSAPERNRTKIIFVVTVELNYNGLSWCALFARYCWINYNTASLKNKERETVQTLSLCKVCCALSGCSGFGTCVLFLDESRALALSSSVFTRAPAAYRTGRNAPLCSSRAYLCSLLFPDDIFLLMFHAKLGTPEQRSQYIHWSSYDAHFANVLMVLSVWWLVNGQSWDYYTENRSDLH